MCGIAGTVAPPSRGVDPGVVARMLAQLHHRGPDGEGMFVGDGVALAMRRLAIIDLEGGQQPIFNEDNTVALVFNGEIYNYQEVRQQLLAKGHVFRTNSDTEVVVHAYEEFGTECPRALRGMFAFAIWDSNRERLFLARDRVGKKPLLYAQLSDTLVFASEFRAVLAHPEVSREIDPAAINHYLSFMSVPAPMTAYRDIRKLEPGHWLVWERGKVTTEQYWSLDFTRKQKLSERDAADELLRILRESVRLRMIADVPLGAFLSGGIDSSAVVALMAGLSSQPVKTFSVGFEEAAFDELEHARRVARRFSTDHHEFVVRPLASEILPKLIDHYGEPYADSSAIPTYYVARETRQHVTVALNGDGGDEAFAGYRRYAAIRLASWMQQLPSPVRRLSSKGATWLASHGTRRTRWGELRRFASAAVLPRVSSYMQLVGAFDDRAKRDLYSEDFVVRVEPDSSPLLSRWLDDPNLGVVDALLQTDTMTYLPDDLLVKVDIASMAVSLEARSPFLDHHVLEFAASLPEGLKLHGLTTKYILKKALRGLVPDENLHRPKMGFGVPVGEWLRHELRPMLSQLLLSDRVRTRGLFRPERVRVLVDQHLNRERDWTNQLWTLMMLELWFERFIDASSVDQTACTTSIAAAS